MQDGAVRKFYLLIKSARVWNITETEPEHTGS